MCDLEGHEGAVIEPSLSGTQRHVLEKPAGCSCRGTSEQSQVRRAPEVLKEEACLSGGGGGTSPRPEQLHWGIQPRSAWLEPGITQSWDLPGSEIRAEAPLGTEQHLPYSTLRSYPRWLVSRSLQLMGTSMPSRILTGRWGYGDKAHYHLPSGFPVAGQLSSLSGSLASSSLSPRKGL